jgi:cell division protein FtsQ
MVRRIPWRVPAGVALAAIGLVLGFLWFRDSSFAAVEQVVVTGSGSSEGEQVVAALEAAGAGMSTLHVDEGALRDAVDPFASVADLRVRTDFPHTLRIEVLEHRPVAIVETNGVEIPATGGGLLLEGVRADDVPLIRATKPPLEGRVQDGRALAALRVAAAAPPELEARSERLFFGQGGIRLDLAGGPDLVFGDADAAAEKWKAAARVLADDSSAGATYLDLRVAGVVAAGGVGPLDPEPEPTPMPQSAPTAAVPFEPSTAG